MLSFAGQVWSDAPAVVADTTRALAVTAMAYDAAHDQLIATVGDSNGATLQGLDPVTLATRWTLPAPAVASRIAFADDGSTAYLALPDTGSVWQVDLNNRVAVRSIQVGDRTLGEGPLSIAVRPGSPGTVAVAVGRVDLPLQNFLRVAVWDDGVMRPKTTGYDGDYFVSGSLAELAFLDAGHVVTFDNQSTGCGFNRLALASDGLQPGQYATPLGIYAYCFGEQLAVTAGRVFTSGGAEVDPNTFAYLRRWPGDDSSSGGGFFDVATASWIRVNGGSFTGQDGVQAARAGIEEFESQRYTLRRDVVTNQVSLESAEVTNRMATSGSRIAFTVLDDYTGNIVVHAVDLSAVPPLGHASFTASAASSTGLTGISLAMPGVAIATDLARHRLVVALDEGVGPDGNSLAVVNPDTGVVEQLIPLAGRPANVKVSATGSIAYVSRIGAVSGFDRVDLVSGVVTTLPLRADAFAIKEDDPQSVAVLDYYVGYALTAVHDMAVQGAPIDLRATTGQSQLNWLATNGAGRLVAASTLEIPVEVARFAWTADGLTYSGTDAQPDIAIESQAYGFGMEWDSLGVTDFTTHARGTFPGLWMAQAVAPTSSTSAILAIQSGDTGQNLSWVQASSQGSTWTSTFDMLMTDSGMPMNLAPEVRDAQAFDANQVVVRYAWMDELRTVEPARIYIVKRTP